MHPIIRSSSNWIITRSVSIFKIISSIHFNWTMISFTRSNTFYPPFHLIQYGNLTLRHVRPYSLDHRHKANFEGIISVIESTYSQCSIRSAKRCRKLNIKRVPLYFGRQGDFITSPTLHLILGKSTGNPQKQ